MEGQSGASPIISHRELLKRLDVWNLSRGVAVEGHSTAREAVVNGLIYLIGLIVVIMFIFVIPRLSLRNTDHDL